MGSAIRALYDSDLFPEDRQTANPEYAEVLEYQERHENDLNKRTTVGNPRQCVFLC